MVVHHIKPQWKTSPPPVKFMLAAGAYSWQEFIQTPKGVMTPLVFMQHPQHTYNKGGLLGEGKPRLHYYRCIFLLTYLIACAFGLLCFIMFFLISYRLISTVLPSWWWIKMYIMPVIVKKLHWINHSINDYDELLASAKNSLISWFFRINISSQKKFNNRFTITDNLLFNTIKFKFRTVDQHCACRLCIVYVVCQRLFCF